MTTVHEKNQNLFPGYVRLFGLAWFGLTYQKSFTDLILKSIKCRINEEYNEPINNWVIDWLCSFLGTYL